MTPTSAANVPPEILDNIFHFLYTYTDIQHCQPVCNKWSRVTQERLYEKIYSFSSNAKLETFLETISSSPSNPGAYVKAIDQFSTSLRNNPKNNEGELTEKSIEIIGKNCPKVTCMALGPYTKIEVWEELLLQIRNGRFKHLSFIPVPALPDGYLVYANAAIALSKSLVQLFILCLNIKVDDDDSLAPVSFNHDLPLQYDIFVKNLKSFTNLEQLILAEMNGSGKNLSRYDYLIDQCLVSVESVSFMAQCYPNYLQRALLAENLLTTSDPLPSNNIKSLRIGGYWLIEQEFLTYIMKKFPGLEELKLDFWRLSDIMSTQLMEDLLQYISGLSKYTMTGSVRRGDERKMIEMVAALMENSVNNTRSYSISLNVKLAFKQTEPDVIAPAALVLKSHNNTLYEKNEWTIPKYDGSNRVAYFDAQFTRDLCDIIQARDAFVIDFLNRLGLALTQFYLSEYTTLKPNLSRDCSNQQLYSICDLESKLLGYCNNLRNLELGWMHLGGTGKGDKTITRDSIMRLKFNHCWIRSESLSELAFRLPSLKELCTENCIFLAKTTSKANNPAKISMPDTTLDKLALIWSGEYTDTWTHQYSKVHLKISLNSSSNSSSTSNKRKHQYYSLGRMEMKQITAKKYKEELEVRPVKCLSFGITCKDITTIKIKLSDLPRQITLSLKRHM